MKPLLVGDMPTRATERYWNRPLSGAYAKTLCRAMDIPESDSYARWTWALYDRFECINAFPHHSAWDHESAARSLAHKITARHEVVVLFGRKVQKAYADMNSPATSEIENADFYEWNIDILSYTGRRQVLVLPAIRVIKGLDSEHRRLTGRLLNEAIEKAEQMHETRL
jgi:hypothetical protein